MAVQYSMSRTRLIDDQRSWQHVAAKLASEPLLALDTESNSLHTYRERVCLIRGITLLGLNVGRWA